MGRKRDRLGHGSLVRWYWGLIPLSFDGGADCCDDAEIAVFKRRLLELLAASDYGSASVEVSW
jgi:hypothetical protein